MNYINIVNRKSLRENKRLIFIWILIGTLLFTLINSLFYYNTCRYNSNAIYSNDSTILDSTNSKIEFRPEKDYEYNIINIYVDLENSKPVQVNLSADDTTVEISLHNGLNEIKYKSASELKIEIADSTNRINIEKIIFRKSSNIRTYILYDFISFILIWISLIIVKISLNICTNNIISKVVGIVELIIIILFSTIIICNKIQYKYPVIFIVLICSAVIILYKEHIIRLMTGRYFDIISSWKMIGLYIIIFTTLLIISEHNIISEPISDVGEVYQSAAEILNNGHVNNEVTGQEALYWSTFKSNNDYFVINLHNIPILLYYTLYYKLISFIGVTVPSYNAIYLAGILNIIHIVISVIFGIITADIIFGEQARFIFSIMSFMFIPYYTNVGMLYTDIISMTYVSLAILLYIYADSNKNSIIYFITGCIISIGTLLKGSAILLLIAICMHLVLKCIHEKLNIKYIVCIIVGYVIINLAFSLLIEHTDFVDLSYRDKLEFPKIHWVMMGLNPSGNGGYVQDDFNYTASFSTKKDKEDADIKLLLERLADYDNPKDFVNNEINKLINTWSDGKFMDTFYLIYSYNKGKWYEYIEQSSSKYIYYYTYVTTYIYVIYILIIVGTLRRIRRSDLDNIVFIEITLVGLVTFLLMWESRSRYILNYSTLLMLCACSGIFNKHLVMKE